MLKDPYPIILRARSELPAICDEVNEFAKYQAKPAANYGERLIQVNDRLISAIFEGFLQRHISIFDAILLLAKSGHRAEWLMLSRSLFEVSVDAAMFWDEILSKGEQTTTLGRIRYAWSINNLYLLKDSEGLDQETLEKLKAKVEKVPGLSEKEHEKIQRIRNFTGLDMRARSEKVQVGKYYKPVFSRLSKYAHGMSYDREIAFAENRSLEKLGKQEVTEEVLNLYHCAILVLEGLEMLCSVTRRIHNSARSQELKNKLEKLIPIA